MRPSAVALVFASAVTSGLTLGLLARQACADDQLTAYGLRLEAGAELDSNPTRRETVDDLPPTSDRVPSAAWRIALSGDLEQRATSRLFLSLGGGLAARRLDDPAAEGEDLLVIEGRSAFGYALGEHWSLGAGASLYDVDQRADGIEEARDFRSLAPAARLTGRAGAGRVTFGAGWRWFTFKPAHELDFQGPSASLGFRVTPVFALDGGAEWDWGFASAVEERHFPLVECASGSDCPASGTRRDHFVTFDADVTRTGDVLLGAGFGLQHNGSDRYGESLWRFLGHLRFVTALPWGFSLATRAELVVTSYEDAVPVGHNGSTGAFVTIEDEGRSSLRVDLSHAIGAHIEAGARATFYTQTPTTGPVHFARQLYLVYLALTFGR